MAVSTAVLSVDSHCVKLLATCDGTSATATVANATVVNALAAAVPGSPLLPLFRATYASQTLARAALMGATVSIYAHGRSDAGFPGNHTDWFVDVDVSATLPILSVKADVSGGGAGAVAVVEVRYNHSLAR